MADNVTTNAGTGGATIATDDVGGVHYPISKLAYGVLDSVTLVSASAGLPVAQQGAWSVSLAAALPAGTNAIGKLAANDGVDIGDVTVNNGSGASAVNIQDGGNSITVDDGGGSLTVDGTVSVSGSVSADTELPAAGALADAAANPTTPTVGAASLVFNGSSWDRVRGDTTNGIDVDVTRVQGNVTVVGTGTFAVQAAQSGAWSVSLGAAIPAGTNNIGDVDVLTLPALPAGANTIGSIASITTSVTPGTGAAELGKAEDAAHSSGDVGVMGLAVRRDANTSLVGTDGDYAPLQVDANGNLKVNIVSGAGSGGTAMTDDAAFTPGTTSITPVGGTYRTTRDTLDDNDAGAIALTQRRAQLVSIEDSAGDSCMDDTNNALRVNIVAGASSGGVSMTDDSAFTVGSSSVTPAAGTYRATRDLVDDGDIGALAMTPRRALLCSLEDSTGDSVMDDSNNAVRVNIVAGAGSGGTAMTDDAAFTVGTTSFTPIGGTYRSTRDTLDDNDGGAVALTQRRAQLVSIEDADGDSCMDGTNNALRVNVVAVSANPEYVVDDAAPTAPSGYAQLMERDDALSTLSEVDGDWTNMRSNSRGALWAAIDGSVTAVAAGDVAHDAADSGNPVKVGARAVSTLPTAVSANDRANLIADLNGRLITRPHCPPGDILRGVSSATGTGDTSIIAAQGAGTRIHVTSASVCNASATNVIVEIKSGTTVIWRTAAPANGGSNLTFDPPLRLGDNEALQMASLTSATTVYFSANGFRGE